MAISAPMTAYAGKKKKSKAAKPKRKLVKKLKKK